MDDYLSQEEDSFAVTVYESCTDEDKQTVDELMESGMSMSEALAEIGYC